MIDYALKNITKRFGRSVLTVIGVSIMMTLVIVITGIVKYQKQTMHAHASAGAGKINVQPLLAGDAYPAQGIDMSEEKAAEILTALDEYIQLPLSAKVVYLELAAPLYPNDPPQLILTGIERSKEEAFTGTISLNVNPVSGTEFFAEADAAHPAILGHGATAYYTELTGSEIHTGDTIAVMDKPFIVIGLLEESADQVVNNSVIVPLEEAQALVDKQGFISSLIVTQVRVGADQDITATVNANFPQMYVIDESTTRRNLDEGIRLFEQLVNAIATVVVLCAAFLIMTVTLITVKERTREIGVLRAIGASNRMVITAIFWEVFILSSVGSVIGGILAGFILTYAMQENLFNLGHILAYLPLAIVLTLIAGLLPARNLSRILPVESLRYE